MRSFADLDRAANERGRFAAETFELLEHTNREIDESVDHFAGDWVLAEWPDISYRPAGWSCEGKPFVLRQRIFYAPSREREMEDLLESYARLARVKRSRLGFRGYRYLEGPELPCFQIEKCALDAGMLERQEEEAGTVLGEEGAEIRNRLHFIAQRIERRGYLRRPDLSFASDRK